MGISAEFKGIWMTRELVLSDLNIYEEKLLSIVWALDKMGSRGCDATNKYLAQFMKGVKPARISNILNGLINGGHIKRTIKYYPDSKQIDRRWLKVVSPLLLTIDRINSDPFLSDLSHSPKGNTPFTESEYPIHSKGKTPSPTMNTPFTESESNNIEEYNIEEYNKSVREDFSRKIGGRGDGFTIDNYYSLWAIQKTDSVLNNYWYNLSERQKISISEHLPKYLRFNPTFRTTARKYLSSKKWEEQLTDRRPQGNNGQLANPKVLPTNTTLQYLN